MQIYATSLLANVLSDFFPNRIYILLKNLQNHLIQIQK